MARGDVPTNALFLRSLSNELPSKRVDFGNLAREEYREEFLEGKG